jgi:hypothetical protein
MSLAGNIELVPDQWSVVIDTIFSPTGLLALLIGTGDIEEGTAIIVMAYPDSPRGTITLSATVVNKI